MVQTPFTIVIDTTIFNLILKYQLQDKFIPLALFTSSAVFCRMSPSEKSKIVELLQQLVPDITTLAIGDGANDAPMIRMAHIGVGVAGKEGLHACNSADITVPAFKFLKRILFCYGRQNHIRNQEMFEYSIEKNSIVALMHVVYSYFNLYSI